MSLSDEQPIEGVPVQSRQAGGVGRVGRGYGQLGESVTLEQAEQLPRKLQPALRLLQLDLPGRRRADRDLVVWALDPGLRGRGEPSLARP